MKKEKLSKLTLNQETLRHMTREDLRTVAGGFALSLPVATCQTGFTCPECNPPVRKEE